MNTVKLKTLITALLAAIILTGCSEIKTTDPEKTYKYWAGMKPPADLELIHGQYWQSAHWTKEYIMYLEFKPTKDWCDELVLMNDIIEDKDEWSTDSDAPDWFKPSDNSIRHRLDRNFDQGSRYFRDTLTGVCYIYEIQL